MMRRTVSERVFAYFLIKSQNFVHENERLVEENERLDDARICGENLICVYAYNLRLPSYN